ncbi:hypothetical protein RND71_031874 [Anisodus tanguticus]|uniref:Bet v I/Major latex protein domain-containing protein n=1 Tax=Anisodus tanguticus TaxID=243964 RepID=A0AAE1V585_9SOLA|nr:hypothetical protein RND71_031874 [Anisodus tanguticus]
MELIMNTDNEMKLFNAGSNFKSIKYRLDELNEQMFTFKYTMAEGEALIDKLEKITYEVKFEQSADDGSISKVTSKYYTEGAFKLNEEEIKAGKGCWLCTKLWSSISSRIVMPTLNQLPIFFFSQVI